MAEHSLADRIRGMAEYVDKESIAKAVGLPVHIIEGVLSGEIPDEALEEFDPSRPPDIRVVEQKRFVRSRVIGILSPGGCGGTVLTASLAALSSQRVKHAVAAFDFSEFPFLPAALGLNSQDAFSLNTIWNGDEDFKEKISHSYLKNLHIYVSGGKSDLLTGGKTSSLLLKAGKEFNLVWVDCPSSPYLWPDTLPYMDLLLIVLRQDFTGLNTLNIILPLLEKENILDRSAIIFNFDGLKGGLSAAECRKAARTLGGNIPVMECLPFEHQINQSLVAKDIYVLTHRQSMYAEKVNRILDVILPDTANKNKQGLLGKLKNMFAEFG